MPEQEYDTSLPEEAAAETVTPEVAAPEAAEEGAEAEVGLASPTFTVKVDGEDVQVTMEEALQGYQRQSDYTRKTQALASEREQLSQAQQLWDAIENNPQATVAALAAAYGFSLSPQQAAAVEAQRGQAAERDPWDELDEPTELPKGEVQSPADPRFDRIEQFIADQQAREQANEVMAEVNAVNAKYGVSVDPEALIEYAVENSIGNLDAAFRAMSYEAAQQQAVRIRAQGRKQQLPPVAPGHPIAAGVVVPGAGSALPSLDEAFAAALAEAEG